MEDEVNIEVDQFNQAVITRSFNETVLDEVAQHLDLENGKKALIFAANDKHADMVTEILREKLGEWQEEEERAVLKITSSVHDSLEAIRRFKNEAYPKVAVTVDLLTTGIDVPESAPWSSCAGSNPGSCMNRCWDGPPGPVSGWERSFLRSSTRFASMRLWSPSPV